MSRVASSIIIRDFSTEAPGGIPPRHGRSYIEALQAEAYPD